MNRVAVQIPGDTRFVCSGVPTHSISGFHIQPKDVPVENSFYMEDDFLRHIANHYTIETLDKIFSRFSDDLDFIYLFADNVIKPSPKTMYQIHHNPFLKLPKKFICKNTIQTPNNHMYEYDVHGAFASMLMYKYYFSEVDEGHACHDLCVNPLRNVHNVSISDGSVTLSYDSKTYLCSTLSDISTLYSSLIESCYRLIDRCWDELKIDCSHLVYSIVVSQILKTLHNDHKKRIIQMYTMLLTLSSQQILLEKDDPNFYNYFCDAVICKNREEITPPSDKTLGERYYKIVGRKPILFGQDVESMNVVQDFQNVKSYGFGWASYDVSHIENFDMDEYSMYHIDIKDAYPSRLYNKTNMVLNKKQFGVVKRYDSRLFQSVRLDVSKTSLNIFDRLGIENVVYWKTDGGIVVVPKDVKVEWLLSDLPSLHIDKVLKSSKVSFPDNIDIPEHLESKYDKMTWAYKVTTERSTNLYWANGYEPRIQEILEHNGIDCDSQDIMDIYGELLIYGKTTTVS